MRHTKVLSASTLIGDGIRNSEGEDLGKLEELMIDLDRGNITYAVVSFGGFLGVGNKLFAVPWSAFEVLTEEHKLLLDVDRATLENAPGFDKDDWPDMADPDWQDRIGHFYRGRHRAPASRGADRSFAAGTDPVPPATPPIHEGRTETGDPIPPARTRRDPRTRTDITGTDPKLHPPQS